MICFTGYQECIIIQTKQYFYVKKGSPNKGSFFLSKKNEKEISVMVSRELTFAEEAAIYEIEARKALSEECDPENIILIERGRRIILKAIRLIKSQEHELALYERKISEDTMTKDEIDLKLKDYGYKRTSETDMGIHYLKWDDPCGRTVYADILMGKVFISSFDTVNGGMEPTYVLPEELDLFRRRAELWTAEEKK